MWCAKSIPRLKGGGSPHEVPLAPVRSPISEAGTTGSGKESTAAGLLAEQLDNSQSGLVPSFNDPATAADEALRPEQELAIF